jgi:hypothetical protein
MNTRSLKVGFLLAVATLCPLLWAAKPAKQTKKQAPVTAVEVKGKLVARGYKAPSEPEPPRPRYYWELENGFKEVTPDRIAPDRELAVVLLGKTDVRAEPIVEVAFTGGSLMPSTIVVRPNTTLQVRNQDEIGHELYAPNLNTFSAEAIAPRAIRSVRLTAPGKWPLLDRLIAHVRGYLYVVADLVAAAKVSPEGEFSFSRIAPGKYRLKVFFGPHELVSKSVEISAQEEVSLDPVVLPSRAKAK